MKVPNIIWFIDAGVAAFLAVVLAVTHNGLCFYYGVLAFVFWVLGETLGKDKGE